MFLVPKKNGTRRLVIDWRKLNDQTVKNQVVPPPISDLLDRLGEARVFSQLDLRSGYNQVRLREEDCAKTAFCTPDGRLFEYRVMGFGLCNAPATFQSLMTHVLAPHGAYCLWYLDDITIFSHTIEEHREHLEAVFASLKEHHLYCNAGKCVVGTARVALLGHVIEDGKVQPDPEKLDGVHSYPAPTSV